jgi:hypothetical protein
MSERSTVIGVFEDSRMAQQAIEELKQAGFDHIGFMMRSRGGVHPDITGKKVVITDSVTRGIIGGVIGTVDALMLPIIGPSVAESALETTLPAAEEVIDTIRGATHSGMEANTANNEARDETAIEAAAISDDTNVKEEIGAVSGGVVGGVLGATSALLIPGIGLVIAGGTLVAALSAAAMGAVAGGFLNALEDMGVSEKKAHYYKHEFEVGRTIVTVKADGREQEASDLLKHNGAHDVEIHQSS